MDREEEGKELTVLVETYQALLRLSENLDEEQKQFLDVPVSKEDLNTSFTEQIKRLVADGLQVSPWVLERLEDEILLNYPTFHEGGLVLPEGETTTLPCLIKNNSMMKIPTPKFTIGELVDIKETGCLAYILGVKLFNYEEEPSILKWHYDYIELQDLYDDYLIPDSCYSDRELNQITSLERLPLKVNFPKFKIGDILEDHYNVDGQISFRMVTAINWKCHVNIKDYIEESFDFKPYYSFDLSRFNIEKKLLDPYYVHGDMTDNEVSRDFPPHIFN